MVLTTDAPSSTSVESPARCAEIAAASPHGPPPTMRRSIIEADDLVAPRADADVGDPRLDQLLQAIDIRARRGRQVLESTQVARRLLPAFHPLVARHDAIERRDVARKLGVDVASIFVP